jgi:flagellar protein FlaG
VGNGRRVDAQPVANTDTTGGARQTVAAGGNAAPPAAAVTQPQQSSRDVAQATRDISDYIQTVSRSLSISVDADLGSTVIKVMDADTEEIVRQIPAEEILQIARFLADQQASAESDGALKGLLMDQEG